MSIFYIYPPQPGLHLSYSDAQLGVSQHPERPFRVWRRSYPCLYLSLFCDFAFCLDENGPQLDLPSHGFIDSHILPSPPIHSWLASFCNLSFNVLSTPTLSLTTSGEDHHLLSFQLSSKLLKINMYCCLCLFQPTFAT